MKQYSSTRTLTTTSMATVLLLLLASKANASDGTTRIAGYQTKSAVTGSAIDLDQAEMERHLDALDFEKAKQIYEKGAHMGPVANLRLEEPIGKDFESGDDKINVIGMTDDGQEAVFGHLSSNKLYKGQSGLSINYSVSLDQYKHKQIPCAVGGRDEPNMEGCLAAKGGLILDGYGAVNYYYDPKQDNGFWATLYGFSEQEAERMFHCKDHCPYPEYEKFYQYYGQMDYGNLWIEAAMNGGETTFDHGSAHFSHGNENFAYLSQKGRAEAIKTATVTMNVFTQVNRIMTEWSVERCHKQCNGVACPEAAEPWDNAVATYAGSLEGADGTGQGYLLYGLADQLCSDFATCGVEKNNVEGTSGVNLEIIQQFQTGRSHLEAGNCDTAQEIKFKVDQLMTVPLIQGTLRSAHRLQFTNKGDDQERGRAAGFVAAILPEVYACNHMDASIIYQNMRLETPTPNFADVKAALERNYECMNIQCGDVGGVWDASTGKYHKGAEPCDHRRTSAKTSGTRTSSDSTETIQEMRNNGIAAFLLCNMVVVAALVVKRNRWVPALSSQIDSIWSRQFSNEPTLRPIYQDPSYTLAPRDDAGLYEPMAPPPVEANYIHEPAAHSGYAQP